MKIGRIKYWFKSKKRIIDDVDHLCDRVDELESKINKATYKLNATLNCIKDCITSDEYCNIHTDYVYALEDGLKILQGSDKE